MFARFRIFLIAMLSLVLLVVSPARATNFAILLTGSGDNNTATCDNLQWFSQSGGYSLASISFLIPPSALQTPKEFRLEYPSRSPSISSLPADVFSFDASLYDPATDSYVTQFEPPVTITAQMQWSPNQADPLCLGYFDESKNTWTCQDECLRQGDQTLCGKTDHFSTFALTPLSTIPEPASLSLIALTSSMLMRRNSRA